MVWFLFPSEPPEPRRTLPEEPFPPEWLRCLEENVALYRRLPKADQANLRDALRIFIDDKHWEGCQGLTVTDEMMVTVAAQACLLTLGWEDHYLNEPKTVLIYPGSYLAPVRDRESEEQWRHGEAHYRGPVVLSWWHARWDSRRLGRSNLVLHEFAHKLAEHGDWTTGMPPVESVQLYEQWEDVVAPEYDRLVEAAEYGRPTLLHHHGATSRAEFFAVATECFFLKPEAVRKRHPELYQLLAEFYAQDPAGWRALGLVQQEQAESADQEYWRQAIAECDAAIRMRPEWAEAYRWRADSSWQLGDYHRAVADYGHVIRLTRDDERAQAYYDRGYTYRDAGRHKEALADFDKALQLLPTYVEAYRQRGRTFREQGDLHRALADLTRAIHVDPRDDANYVERGVIHCLRQEYPKALRDFGKAIRLYPYWEEAFLHRAEAHLALEEYDSAVADCDEALQLNPDRPEPYRHRGLAHYHMGDFEKAVLDCSEAIRLDPDYTEAFAVRARAYAALGDPDRANQDRAKAKESNEGDATG